MYRHHSYLFRTALLIVALVTHSVIHAQNFKSVSVELKWFHQVQFAGIYAAKEKGYYHQAGLNVSIIERDVKSNPIQDVLSGKVDFGVSDSTLIKERMMGKPVVLLAAIFQHSPLVLISLEKNKIISPLEVKGKKVMYQKGVDDAIILAMFKEFSIFEKDFIFVPHNFKNDALISDAKNIEVMSAYLSNQPYLYQEKGIKLNVVKPQNYGIDFYGDMIFTSEKFFKQNKDAALAFRQATIKGWKYALKHPDEIYAWLKTKYISKKDDAALRYEMAITKRMIVPEHIEIGYVSASRLDNIAQLYQRLKPNLKNSDLEGLYYKDYDKKNRSYYIALYVFLVVIGILILVVLIMLAFNRQLKAKIKEHTRVIENANKESQYYFLMLNKHVCLLYLDSNGKIIDCSAAFSDFIGIDKNVLTGHAIFDSTVFSFYTPKQKEQFARALQEHSSFAGEILESYGETPHVFQFTLTSSQVLNKKSNSAVVILNDVTDKKQIEKISVTDTVTKLANRFHLNNVLQQEIAGAERYNQPLAIIMFDLDYFKKINDTQGHNAGDELLEIIGGILKDVLRDADVAGRWGGDEFVILCRNTNVAQARIIAEKLRKMIAELSLGNVYISASFGVAEWQVGDCAKKVINNADNALYVAKEQGRNVVIEYTRDISCHNED